MGSSGGFDEARELGEAIEQQTGYPLPVRACNNPFQYKGDIAVKIEKFRLPGLLIERAKAPYTNDVYYRIHFLKRRSVTLVKMAFLDEDCWTMDDASEMDGADFAVFKCMLVKFEEAYQPGVYTAER